MAPEYGATIGLFAVDRETLNFLAMTGRECAHLDLVQKYAQPQGVWCDEATPEPQFTEILEVNLDEIEPSRPQDRIPLGSVPASFRDFAETRRRDALSTHAAPSDHPRDGDVVIAAITSCTNTASPSVVIEAGVLARNAVCRGLRAKSWVKTSLAPGPRVVADYLRAPGLQCDLGALGFNIVGFGCTTCMGSSGPLDGSLAEIIDKEDRIAVAVLSGNRNFEGRVSIEHFHPRSALP